MAIRTLQFTTNNNFTTNPKIYVEPEDLDNKIGPEGLVIPFSLRYNDNTILYLEAPNTHLGYNFQKWTDSNNNTWTTRIISNLNVSANNNYTVTYVGVPITITTQPANITKFVNQDAEFNIIVSGTTPITYKWEEYVAGQWEQLDETSRITGINTSTLKISSCVIQDNNRQFRCVVTNIVGSKTSNTAKLTVNQIVSNTISITSNISGISVQYSYTDINNSIQSGADIIPFNIYPKDNTQYNISVQQSIVGNVESGLDYIFSYFLINNSSQIYNNNITNTSTDNETINAYYITEQLLPPLNFRSTNKTYNTINLAWDSSQSGETSYEIERKKSTDTTYISINTLQSNVKSYNDTNLIENTTYDYRIRSVRTDVSVIYSEWSILSVKTLLNSVLPPTNVTSLTTGTSTIQISWTEPVGSNHTHYQIERSVGNNVNYIYITSVSIGTNIYINNNLNFNTQYFYRIRSFDSLNNKYSEYSNETFATTLQSISKTNITFINNLSSGQIQKIYNVAPLDMNNVINQINGNTVPFASDWKQTSGQQLLLTFSTDYVVSGRKLLELTDNLSRSWIVGTDVFVNGNVVNFNNVYIPETQELTFGFTYELIQLLPPLEPIILNALNSTAVNIKWLPSGTGETSYEIWRAVGNATYSPLFIIPATSQYKDNNGYYNYTDTGLTQNTSYSYKIRSLRSTDNKASDFCNAQNIITPSTSNDQILAPTNFSAQVLDSTSIRLLWDLSVTAVSYYEISRSTDRNIWNIITTVNPVTDIYVDKSLKYNTTYYYRIRSVYDDSVDGGIIKYSNYVESNSTTPQKISETLVNFNSWGLYNNSILSIKVDPPNEDPTGIEQAYYRQTPYSQLHSTNTEISIEFPKYVDVKELIEISDDFGQSILPSDITYNSITHNYTAIIKIPEVNEYNLTFFYNEIKEKYNIILKSENPLSGIKIKTTTDKINYIESITDNTKNVFVEYNNYDIVYVETELYHTDSLKFSYWIKDGEIVEIYGQDNTIEINLIRDIEIIAVYETLNIINAPQNVVVTNGYKKIYLKWDIARTGTLPYGYNIYKYIPIYTTPTQQVDGFPSDGSGNPIGPPIRETDSVIIQGLSENPGEYTKQLLWGASYYLFEDIKLNVSNITQEFVDYDIPINSERCYVISSYDNNTEKFSKYVIGKSTESGVGIRITTEPSDIHIKIGETATFIVIAAGVDSISYQWYENGVSIKNATGNSLSVINAQYSKNLYKYYCIVKDNISNESITSLTAQLYVEKLNAPTNLIASPTFNDITLRWIDNNTNEAGFLLYHSYDGNVFTLLKDLQPNILTYTDINIPENTRKWYRILTYIGTTYSDYSNTIIVQTLSTAINPPYSLVATPGINSIRLDWIDDSFNENGFNIWVADEGNQFILLDSIDKDATSYIHTNLIANITKYYKISAFNSYNESDFSNIAVATPIEQSDTIQIDDIDTSGLLSTPRNLTAISINEGIKLFWTDDSFNETGFTILRSGNGIDFDEIDKVDANITEFLDELNISNLHYWYKIYAFNETNTSAYSNIVDATTLEFISNTNELTIPYDLTSISSVNKIVLIWKNNNLSVTGYKIYFNYGETDNFDVLDIVDGSTLTYTHLIEQNLKNINIKYKITSFIGDNESDFSNVITAKTEKELDTSKIASPENLTAIPLLKSIKLIWIDKSYNETGFEIWASNDNNNFTLYKIVLDNISEFIDEIGLSNITKYYKVRSFNDSYVSDFTNVVNATTVDSKYLPNAPTNLITTSGPNRIHLQWNVNSDNEIGFNVYRSIKNKNNFIKIAIIYSVGIKIDKFTDYNLLLNDSFCYKVSAFNSNGESDFTNIHCSTVEDTGTTSGGATGSIINNSSIIGQKMSIDWSSFNNSLSSYFESKSSKSERDTAEYIAKLYDNSIKLGTEQYGNRVLASNYKILENYIYIAFTDAKNGATTTEVSKIIANGVVLYWTSIQMQAIVPPPSSATAIYNKIIFPGNPIDFPIINSIDSEKLSKSLTDAFKIHSKTITGVLTSLVSTPSGFVPVPFQWVSFG